MGLRAYYANSCVWTNVTGTQHESDADPENNGFMYNCTEAVMDWDPDSAEQTAWAGKVREGVPFKRHQFASRALRIPWRLTSLVANAALTLLRRSAPRRAWGRGSAQF